MQQLAGPLFFVALRLGARRAQEPILARSFQHPLHGPAPQPEGQGDVGRAGPVRSRPQDAPDSGRGSCVGECRGARDRGKSPGQSWA